MASKSASVSPTETNTEIVSSIQEIDGIDGVISHISNSELTAAVTSATSIAVEACSLLPKVEQTLSLIAQTAKNLAHCQNLLDAATKLAKKEAFANYNIGLLEEGKCTRTHINTPGGVCRGNCGLSHENIPKPPPECFVKLELRQINADQCISDQPTITAQKKLMASEYEKLRKTNTLEGKKVYIMTALALVEKLNSNISLMNQVAQNCNHNSKLLKNADSIVKRTQEINALSWKVRNLIKEKNPAPPSSN